MIDMARKKKSMNRSAMIVTIVAIILIIIVGITSEQRENITFVEKWVGNILSPIQNTFNRVMNTIGSNVTSLANLTRLKEENAELKETVEALEKEVLNLSISRSELEELKNLKYALNYIDEVENKNLITADITGKSPGNWFNLFTINVGENQGVKKDNVVLDSNGLVGKVYEVGGNWSKVISIIDNNSSVSFQLMRDSSLQGIVTGSISNEITGYLFDPLADVIVGDKIITSGLGIYPAGIQIGEVVGVDKTGDHLLKTIKVEPSVNFKRLTKVIIVTQDQIDY